VNDVADKYCRCQSEVPLLIINSDECLNCLRYCWEWHVLSRIQESKSNYGIADAKHHWELANIGIGASWS
jgi:hypothetical protein